MVTFPSDRKDQMVIKEVKSQRVSTQRTESTTTSPWAGKGWQYNQKRLRERTASFDWKEQQGRRLNICWGGAGG